MRKKVIAKRAPREKIYKLPTKPSTRSQNRTFTPSPSPPTSPPRCDPMARTKNTPRFPASAKPTPPPKATPSKPASSKPGSSKPPSSKGKRPATEEPVPEPQQPRARATRVNCKEMDSPLTLLLTWAWIRLPFLAPIFGNPRVFPIANSFDVSSLFGRLMALNALSQT
nr:extensin-like [Arachis hypogaea]